MTKRVNQSSTATDCHIGSCSRCKKEKQVFTYFVSRWSPHIHWWFPKRIKKVVFPILVMWKYGASLLSKLPKDVLFIVISHIVMLRMEGVYGPFQTQCDECTKYAMSHPQCSKCIEREHLPYPSNPTLTRVRYNGENIMAQKLCFISTCNNILYSCDAHKEERNSIFCERCINNWAS
jgi:hypothetical protein